MTFNNQATIDIIHALIIPPFIRYRARTKFHDTKESRPDLAGECQRTSSRTLRPRRDSRWTGLEYSASSRSRPSGLRYARFVVARASPAVDVDGAIVRHRHRRRASGATPSALGTAIVIVSRSEPAEPIKKCSAASEPPPPFRQRATGGSQTLLSPSSTTHPVSRPPLLRSSALTARSRG